MKKKQAMLVCQGLGGWRAGLTEPCADPEYEIKYKFRRRTLVRGSCRDCLRDNVSSDVAIASGGVVRVRRLER